MKKILLILFAIILASFGANAQTTPFNSYGWDKYGTGLDSLLIKGGANGNRVMYTSKWIRSLISGGGVSPTYAGNGLVKVADTIKMGGAVTGFTSIGGNGLGVGPKLEFDPINEIYLGYQSTLGHGNYIRSYKKNSTSNGIDLVTYGNIGNYLKGFTFDTESGSEMVFTDNVNLKSIKGNAKYWSAKTLSDSLYYTQRGEVQAMINSSAIAPDSTVFRTVANSRSLAQTQTALNLKVDKTTTLNNGFGINSIGNLSSNRTIAVDSSTVAYRVAGKIPASQLPDNNLSTSQFEDIGSGVIGIKTSYLNTISVPIARSVIAGSGLTGGGALSADITLKADTSILMTKANTLSLSQIFTRFGSGNFYPEPTEFQGGGTSTSDYFNLKLVSVAKGGTGLATLPNGLLKSATNVISAAVSGTDYLAPNGSAAALTSFPTFNQNTTGSAATLTTARTLWGVSFNGSANVTAKPVFITPTTATASINLPHGVAPTSPVNGDEWTTTAGAFHRINGITKQVLYTADIAQIVEVAGTTQTMVANTIYIPHNASQTTFTLPATAAVGALFQIIGEGAGSWKIAQGATGQTTVGVGGFTSTSGTAGGVTATDRAATITIRCVTANTKFTITTSQGTITSY